MSFRPLIALTVLLLMAPPTSVSAAEKTVIPVFRLSGPITEKPVPEDFPFALGGPVGESLFSLLQRIDQARTDESVPAIVVQTGSVSISGAQRSELIRSLQQLKAAGKKVHVHTDIFTTRDLALLAHASEISMVPTGYMFINGFYGEQVYLRGMLDKLGIVPDYFTCGDYKSAGEMFMRTGPSEEAAKMHRWLYDSIWQTTLSEIAGGRDVDPKTAEQWIDKGVFTAERAVEAGIIDKIEHHQQFESRLKKQYGDDLKFDRKYGRKSAATIDLSSPFGLMNFYADLLAPPRKASNNKPGVGIVYLEGAIMPGSAGGNPFLADAAAFSETIRKALDEAAADDAIKAVVFRVDSPGGSAVASEVILNAAKRVAAKKPLIVSMGNVAGSGGYYVSCGTDTIFAEPSTVTASIGVVMGKFATTGLWDKLGIQFKPIEYGRNAGMLSSADVFTDEERAALQTYMDEVYEVFKGHVVKARGEKLTKPIEELAGGRVFTGRQALELGLVDQLGGLQDAIAFAADKADLHEGYDVRVVPRPKNFMELLMSDLSGSKDDGRHLMSGQLQLPAALQAALPMLQQADPQRASAVKQALLQLLVLQKERACLTMPILTP